MTARRAALIAAILLAALVVVALILLRPMAPEAYATGPFSFEAVTEIRVSAGTYTLDTTAPTLSLSPEDRAFEELIGLFEGRGFGRTPGSIFSAKPPAPRVGDLYWNVTFLCGHTGAALTVRCQGGDLRMDGGGGAVAVSARHKTAWAKTVHDDILALYPEPEDE